MRSWGDAPRLIFNPVGEVPKRNGLYIGMEIETNFRDSWYFDEPSFIDWRSRLPQNLFWIKPDSSIHNGIEITTHPFEPEWGLENFPFELFDELIEEHGAYADHPCCGGHIHMSKDAFTSSHLHKFLKFHRDARTFVQAIGGRDSCGAANWTPGLRSLAIASALKETAISKRQGWSGRGAINLGPPNTIELRYPAGASSGLLIKKNIQWVLTLFDFTKEVEAGDVRLGALSPQVYYTWLKGRKEQYPELMEWIERKATIEEREYIIRKERVS